MELQQQNPTVADEVHYCEVHPDRETSLRCNKCGRYMCVQCAVQTPVGYRCRQCVRQHEDKFFQGTNNDYLIVFVACAVLGGIAGVVSRYIGFPLIILIVAFPVGGFISEIALRLIKRRRGRRTGEVGAAGVVIGGLIGAVLQVYLSYNAMFSQYAGQLPEGTIPPLSLDMIVTGVVSDVWMLLFVGIIAFAVYGRFRMKF